MMIYRRFERTILLVALALLGGSWILISREPAEQPSNFLLTEAPIVGHLAPDFTLATPLGELVSLSDQVDRDGNLGRPVVLNFWASWCGPCRIETPHLQNASLKHKNRVAILGINQGENASTVSEFGLSFGLTYPLLVDEEDEVTDLYGVSNLPTTIFIDRKGVVREVFVGLLNLAVLEESRRSVVYRRGLDKLKRR
jgi:thiol-disulfide isomerase/thioredoxin